MTDAPEPDVLEQATPVDEDELPVDDEPTSDPEAPEADALEQALGVPEPDEDYPT